MQNAHKLAYPITTPEGEVITQVKIGRPKAKSIIEFGRAQREGGDEIAALTMVAICTGLPRSVVDEMDLEDFTAVAEIASGFFPAQATPPTPA